MRTRCSLSGRRTPGRTPKEETWGPQPKSNVIPRVSKGSDSRESVYFVSWVRPVTSKVTHVRGRPTGPSSSIVRPPGRPVYTGSRRPFNREERGLDHQWTPVPESLPVPCETSYPRIPVVSSFDRTCVSRDRYTDNIYTETD